MNKLFFLKFLLLIVSMLIMSATAYGCWKINKNFDKITTETNETIVRLKAEKNQTYFQKKNFRLNTMIILLLKKSL